MSIDIRTVKANLKNNFISDIIYHDTVSSTNKLALNIDSKLIKDGMVIVAGEQTEGRGRLKRNWYSPKDKGLWFSIILKTISNLENVNMITLIGALAVNDAVINLGISTDLKWPNDILYKRKKLCGILSQFKSIGNRVDRVVVGIGINVNQNKFPINIKSNSISLKNILGEEINRAILLSDILNNFSYYYEYYKSDKCDIIIDRWKKEMNMLNKEITLKTSDNKKIKGKVIDITKKGELIIKKKDGEIKTFIAGDVSIDKNSLIF